MKEGIGFIPGEIEKTPALQVYETLTYTEGVVLQTVADGHSNKLAGEMLQISPKTVDTHRLHIYKKGVLTLGKTPREVLSVLIQDGIRNGYINHTPPVGRLKYLSTRENDVLIALRAGFSNVEIAHHTGIDAKTVESHLSRIYAKLGVKNGFQAVARATDIECRPKMYEFVW